MRHIFMIHIYIIYERKLCRIYFLHEYLSDLYNAVYRFNY